MRNILTAFAVTALTVACGKTPSGGQANAGGGPDGSPSAICADTVHVLAQPRDSLSMLDKQHEAFKKLAGADFSIDFLNENDRRAKSRLDASTIGKYNVYYVDEANVSLFAKNGWIVPLLDYFPKAYDYQDFDPARIQVATYDNKIYFAPIQGGSDLMYYRKDLLDKAGIAPPKTLDELIADVAKLNDPAHGIYGIALRGQRGSGEDVWRWSPYFYAFGGRLANTDNPQFGNDAGLKATQTYLQLFKFSPPSTRTGGWTEATQAFNSGQVAIIIESAPLAAMTEDAKQSAVAGKVGYAPPPLPLPGAAYGHGLAIGAKANADERTRRCAATFIAWATSKEQEQARLAAGDFGELNRVSVMSGDAFTKKYSPALVQAIKDARTVSQVTFWNRPDWPEVGDRWGILLEELITGTRTDIKGALAEVDAYVTQVKARQPQTKQP